MDSILHLVGVTPGIPWLSELLSAEVTKMTIAFMIAARLHRQWVKKDMTEQFGRVTEAINNVADKLTLDLRNHESRIQALEEWRKDEAG